jgi:hypothetical protein
MDGGEAQLHPSAQVPEENSFVTHCAQQEIIFCYLKLPNFRII